MTAKILCKANIKKVIPLVLHEKHLGSLCQKSYVMVNARKGAVSSIEFSVTWLNGK